MYIGHNLLPTNRSIYSFLFHFSSISHLFEFHYLTQQKRIKKQHISTVNKTLFTLIYGLIVASPILPLVPFTDTLENTHNCEVCRDRDYGLEREKKTQTNTVTVR